ncbi:hypothetical protein AAY473_007888 [Plecturocebus cupreus]
MAVGSAVGEETQGSGSGAQLQRNPPTHNPLRGTDWTPNNLSFSPAHEDPFPVENPPGVDLSSEGGGEGRWHQTQRLGTSSQCSPPDSQKNGELALSSPAPALPFTAPSLCCPQAAAWTTEAATEIARGWSKMLWEEAPWVSLLPRLEYSGTITAPCSLELLGSNLALLPWLEYSGTILAAALNSQAQMILLTWAPE